MPFHDCNPWIVSNLILLAGDEPYSAIQQRIVSASIARNEKSIRANYTTQNNESKRLKSTRD